MITRLLISYLNALPQINVNAIDDGNAANLTNNAVNNTGTGLPVWIYVLLIAVIILIILVLVALSIIIVFIVVKKKNDTNNVIMTSNSVSDLREKPGKANNSVPPMQANSGRTQMMSFTDENLSGYERPLPTKQAYFILTDVKDNNNRFIVKLKSEIIIGRTKGDIVIPFDGAISGIHCKVESKGDLIYLTDLKSGNGTVYDGKKIYEEVSVIPGKILEIGRSKFVLSIEEK